jgi:hypothetical protein
MKRVKLPADLPLIVHAFDASGAWEPATDAHIRSNIIMCYFGLEEDSSQKAKYALALRYARQCTSVVARISTAKAIMATWRYGDRLRRARKSWPTPTCRPGRVHRNLCAHRASLCACAAFPLLSLFPCFVSACTLKFFLSGGQARRLPLTAAQLITRGSPFVAAAQG